MDVLTYLTEQRLKKLREEGKIEGPVADDFFRKKCSKKRILVDIVLDDGPDRVDFMRNSVLGKRLCRIIARNARANECNAVFLDYSFNYKNNDIFGRIYYYKII